MMAALGLRPGDRALDVGCGPATITVDLAAPPEGLAEMAGGHAVPVDGTRVHCQVDRDRIGGEPPALPWATVPPRVPPTPPLGALRPPPTRGDASRE